MSIFRNFALIKAHLVSQAKLPVPTAPVPPAPVVTRHGLFGKLFQVFRARMMERQKTASPMPVRTVVQSARPNMIARTGLFANIGWMMRVPRPALPIFRTLLQQKMAQGIPYYMARDSALKEAVEKLKSAAQGQ